MRTWHVILSLAALAAGGCTHKVQVEPIKVEPIYITLDVRLTVDRELDRFFDFEEDAAVPQPAASPEGTGQGGST
jgi:hypothetical protein